MNVMLIKFYIGKKVYLDSKYNKKRKCENQNQKMTKNVKMYSALYWENVKKILI